VTTRTSKKTVTFRRPFVLGGFDEVLPAGAYSVETDEELLEGISFPAYRRVSTLIHLHAKPGQPGRSQTLTIDPNELDAALKRDQSPAEIPAATDAGQKTLERAERPSSHGRKRRQGDDSAPKANNRPPKSSNTDIPKSEAQAAPAD
jgi:hypothetical protein